jgi:hypothetical protein
VRCDGTFLADRVLVVNGQANTMGIVGYNPCSKRNDLPLECQANQIPKTAIKAEEMPKIICMETSSFMVL